MAIKCILTLTLVLLVSINLSAQNDNKSFLEFSFGRSQHGTGDTPGYHYGFSYGEEFKKKLYWHFGFEGTLNDTPDFLLTYEDPQGNILDASLHTVTAGYQLAIGLRYNFLQSNQHRLGISALPIFRYQATSLSDSNVTLFPAITNLPVPVREITRTEPGRTFAIGASLRFHYSYELRNSFYMGILGAFQIDSNGDSIPHYSIVFGKLF